MKTNDSGDLNVQSLEKTVYHNCKEYESHYIWGHLVGWFKQTVDKPNASLSADRRGTLSMPDLESFIVDQASIGGKKKRKGKKGGSNQNSDEEEMEVMPKSSSRSRGGPSERMQSSSVMSSVNTPSK